MSARDSKFAAAVEAWFVDAQRELPWRRVRNGYTALVSEAMLQQTQVARAVELYEPFMRRFPTVGALAEASEQEVLAAWQGLGYYGRARRLHAAARAIAERFEGEVPADIDALRSLPGVGRYTAGAIASIAFGARVPIVDTNVARVLMRVDARAGTSANPENVEWCWERAAQLVEACTNASHFNEGLMELGAIVCSSAAPKCDVCPLARACRGRAGGDAAAIPAPAPRAARRRVYHHAVVLRRGSKVLLVQRAARGLWSSMWQVPTIESEAALDVHAVTTALPVSAMRVARLREFTHMTTHREVVFVVYRGETRSRSGTWVEISEIAAFPLSNPMRKIVREAMAC